MGSATSKKDGQLISDEDLAFLTASTNYDAATIQEWYTGFLRDCPNGQLSRERFLSMYTMFFKGVGDPDEFCAHVFRTFDADGNGSVDFKEFLLAVGVTTNGSTYEKLKWAFRMYDIDADGHIQAPEMNKIVQALYAMLGSSLEDDLDSPSERTRMIFLKMDTNRDGKLSLDEFLEGCTADPLLAQILSSPIASPTTPLGPQ